MEERRERRGGWKREERGEECGRVKGVEEMVEERREGGEFRWRGKQRGEDGGRGWKRVEKRRKERG